MVKSFRVELGGWLVWCGVGGLLHYSDSLGPLAWGFGNFGIGDRACQYILRSSACYLQYEKSMNKLTI